MTATRMPPPMQPLDHKDHPWNRIENFDLGWVHSTLKAAAKTGHEGAVEELKRHFWS